MLRGRISFVLLVVASLVCASVLAGVLVWSFVLQAKTDFDGNLLASTQLPTPELAPGERGAMGVDANVNETTIDAYLGLPDTVYRDMRMLDDDADWEAIGGDSMLSGYVEGFEVVPYPYLAPVGELPEAVGAGYEGPTLFSKTDGGYEPSFWESLDILEDLFPPDKDIVLMCGAGGYAGMTRDLLISLGWREDHIWVAGGWWYYEGSHGVNVASDNGHGQTTWDFQNVPYHVIDFDALHEIVSETDTASEPVVEIAPGVRRIVDQAELSARIDSGKTFVLDVYLPGCSACAEFADVVSELAVDGQVDVYAMSYRDITDMGLRMEVGHAPGVLVFKNKTLVVSLSPDRDEDLPRYASLSALTGWLHDAIGIVQHEGTVTADVECAEGCEV